MPSRWPARGPAPSTSRTSRRVALPMFVLAAALTACQSGPLLPPTSPGVVGELRPGSGYLKGYLDRKQLPNSLALLPAPAREGSPQQAADWAVYRETRALRDQPRWALAARDANLKFPAAADVYACALDLPITPEGTPHLNMLLRRSLMDAGLATYAAKDHYNRTRPFVAAKEASCTPAEEGTLAKDGSYPSGHAALGWGWALILAELAPDRADVILTRGHAFGQSRVVCGVHWQSDVDAGRVVGAAAVARLHADPVFVAQAAAARREIDEARAKGLRATRDCQAEAQALAR